MTTARRLGGFSAISSMPSPLAKKLMDFLRRGKEVIKARIICAKPRGRICGPRFTISLKRSTLILPLSTSWQADYPIFRANRTLEPTAPNDRSDSDIAFHVCGAGLYRPVHVKTLRSQKLRVLLTHRKLLQSKAIAIENDLRGTLRNFGLKVGMVGKVKFEARIRELVENLPDLAVLVEPMLIVRRTLREQIVILHRRLLAIVRDDEVCRRLMTTPGVGPVVALSYRATVDVPARFRKSKAVGAVFGLTRVPLDPRTGHSSSSSMKTLQHLIQ